MMVTIVATLCSALGNISQPVCREEIVIKDDMSMQSCMISQPALADWKMHSKFNSDNWTISRVKCVPGTYILKDRI